MDCVGEMFEEDADCVRGEQEVEEEKVEVWGMRGCACGGGGGFFVGGGLGGG